MDPYSNEEQETEADLERLFSIMLALIQKQPTDLRIRTIIRAEHEMTRLREDFIHLLSNDAGSQGEVCRKAVRVFECEKHSAAWFFAPNYELGWKIPISFLDKEEGIKLIIDTLGRIEWGVFS